MRRISAILLCALCITRLSDAFCATADTKSKIKSLAKDGTTAGAIGMTGWGGRDLMQGVSEKSADADAEQDMKAYLATFRCDYGQGRNIIGGETGIQLPNASQLASLKSEYTSLAAELKATKAALNMRPGIESELVLDSAESGLYDDVGGERNPGAFTSLSRALLDENGQDAKDWAAQKSKSQDKIKSGAIKAASGVALGVVSNFINTDTGNNSGKSNGKSGIMGLFGNSSAAAGNASGRGGAGTSGNARGASTASGTTAAPGSPDEQIQRAENACDTFRTDIVVRADNMHNEILEIQSDANNNGINTDSIDAMEESTQKAIESIAKAQESAETALSNATGLTVPEEENCDKVTKPELDEECSDDTDEEECQQEIEKKKAAYDKKLEKYKQNLKECQQQSQSKYDADLKKYQSELKKYADDAERHLKTGRTYLGNIENYLSNAKKAKEKGLADKKQREAQTAAAEKKEAELKQSIQAEGLRAQTAAQNARKHYDDALSLSNEINGISLDDTEAAAQEQIDALKENVAQYLEYAKTSMDNAESSAETAASASTLSNAKRAVTDAQRHEADVAARLKSVQGILTQIKNAKQKARDKYLKDQKKNSEEERISQESEEEIDDFDMGSDE